MVSTPRSSVPGTVRNASSISVSSDSTGGGGAGAVAHALPAGPKEEGSRAPVVSPVSQSLASHLFPSLTPAYNSDSPVLSNTAAAAVAALEGGWAVSVGAVAPISTLPTTGAASNAVASTVNPAAVQGPNSHRRGFAGEAQAALERVHQLAKEIDAKDEQIRGLERDLKAVQDAAATGDSYGGKKGEKLFLEEKRLGDKERLLREEKAQLREEKLVLLRSRHAKPDQRRGSGGSEASSLQNRVSFIVTQSHVDDPSEQLEEHHRLSRHFERIKERRQSINGGTHPHPQLGDEAGGDTVYEIHKIEEDPRLLVRLNSFNLPIVVATLLSGFTLVLFDVADAELARRLAVVAFGLQTSSITMLCLIAFRAQQLYARSTDLKPLTRRFLKRTCNVTILSLVLFSSGVIAFVVAFALEASEKMGKGWLGVLAVVMCPTMLAALLFVLSTVQVRRHSVETSLHGPGPIPGTQ